MICWPVASMGNEGVLVQCLRDPRAVLSLDPSGWDLLIRQGRRANLLGKLAVLLLDSGLMSLLPASPKAHLLSALKMAERQNAAIHWEVSRISEALRTIGVDIILLKGAAYVLAGLPSSRGRTFSDVDILVRKSEIIDVESALMIHGWQGSHHDEYDQRYYRKWMHEIPPMLHVRRGTTIDVHHGILPETARIQVNTQALLDCPLPVKGFHNIFVLKPADMVLHSAAHLFHEGELDNGLRDLADLDTMLRHFGVEPSFWFGLVPRARELGLLRPLYYALVFSMRIFNTPCPQSVVAELKAICPSWVFRWLMNACYTRALRPNHASTHTGGTWLARKALYIRSHWIKMPVRLLVWHLLHKAIKTPAKENQFNTQNKKLDAQ